MSEQFPRKVAVIGLGYVGLPVAVAFGMHSRVIGFDIDKQRIHELQHAYDCTQEVDSETLQTATILFTDDPHALADADFHIIAVPTPIDHHKQPDLLPILKASKTVGSHLKKGDVVVYESTVYPGATEEMCIPVLERQSGLHSNTDFSVGYSPERINPGDKAHRFTQITKVISAQNNETLAIMQAVYGFVLKAEIHCAPSIKVAEAAKVIENTQRDINIALINEFAMIFSKMGIDTQDVLAAAQTKWNFMPFTPGLVGGHCIGVDPYYLIYKAEAMGYHPQLIPAARGVNDGMGIFVAQQALNYLRQAGYIIQESIVTILGITFKENVPDLRNTRVIDIVRYLAQQAVTVQVHDPLADAQLVQQEHNVTLSMLSELQPAHCVILAVPHQDYIKQGWPLLQNLLENQTGIVMDIKSILPQNTIPPNLLLYRL